MSKLNRPGLPPIVFNLPSTSFRSSTSSILQSQHYLSSSAIEYDSKDEVGQGAPATVYKGKYLSKTVAVKKYVISNPRIQASQDLLAREAAELLKLDHENIVKCYGVCLDYFSLVLEFCFKTIQINSEDTNLI